MEGQRAGASAGGAADRAALGSAGSGSGSGTAKGRPAPSAWPKKRKASPDAAVPRERSAAAGAGAKPPKRERSSAGSPKREGPAPVLVVEVHTSVPYYAKRQEMWAESVRKGSLPIEFVQSTRPSKSAHAIAIAEAAGARLRGRTPDVAIVGEVLLDKGAAAAAGEGVMARRIQSADWLQQVLDGKVPLELPPEDSEPAAAAPAPPAAAQGPVSYGVCGPGPADGRAASRGSGAAVTSGAGGSGDAGRSHGSVGVAGQSSGGGDATGQQQQAGGSSGGGAGSGDARPAQPDLTPEQRQRWLAMQAAARSRQPVSRLMTRAWVDTAPDVPGHVPRFRVLTWNKLHTGTLRNKWNLPERYKSWPLRKEQVLQRLEKWEADIVMLQEAGGHEWTDIAKWAVDHGYEAVESPTATGMLVRRSRFEVLWWRTHVFNRTGVGGYDSDDEEDGAASQRPRSEWDVQPWATARSIPLDMPMAALRCRLTGRLVVAAGLHLMHTPPEMEEFWVQVDGLKALQVQVACAAIAGFAREAEERFGLTPGGSAGGGGKAEHDAGGVGSSAGGVGGSGGGSGGGGGFSVPVVFGGDLNLHPRWRYESTQLGPRARTAANMVHPDPPPSAGYSLLSRGCLPPSHPDHPAAWAARAMEALGLRDPEAARARNEARRREPLELALGALASGAVAAVGCEPALTFYGPSFAGTIDYTWATPRTLRAVGWLCMPWDGQRIAGQLALRGGGGGGGGAGGAQAPEVAVVGKGGDAAWDTLTAALTAEQVSALWRGLRQLNHPMEAMPRMQWVPTSLYPSDHLEVGVEYTII